MSTNRKILLISLAKDVISGQSDSDTETDLLPDLYGFGFGFKLIIFVFQKSMQILFTDRALPTIRHMDQTFFGGSIKFQTNLKSPIRFKDTREGSSSSTAVSSVRKQLTRNLTVCVQKIPQLTVLKLLF